MSQETTSDVTLDIAIDCVREVLDYKHACADELALDGGTSLDSLLFDSLDVSLLFLALQETAGVELDPDSAPVIETIADLTHLRGIKSRDVSATDRALPAALAADGAGG